MIFSLSSSCPYLIYPGISSLRTSAVSLAAAAGQTAKSSVSHDKVGDMLAAQGNATGALAAYRQGMSIAERDPSNTQWQRDLIVSNVKVAELADDSVQRYRAALEIANKLKQTDRLKPVDDGMIPELERRLKDAAS